MKEGRIAFKILTDKPTGKEDKIMMNLKAIGVNTRNRIDSAHVRDYWRVLLNEALHFRVP